MTSSPLNTSCSDAIFFSTSSQCCKQTKTLQKRNMKNSAYIIEKCLLVFCYKIIFQIMQFFKNILLVYKALLQQKFHLPLNNCQFLEISTWCTTSSEQQIPSLIFGRAVSPILVLTFSRAGCFLSVRMKRSSKSFWRSVISSWRSETALVFIRQRRRVRSLCSSWTVYFNLSIRWHTSWKKTENIKILFFWNRAEKL